MFFLKPYGQAEPEKSLLEGLVDFACILPGEMGFNAALADCEGLLADIDIRVDDALLAKAPKLRAIVCRTIGVDFVDLEAAKRRGVMVFNSPDYCTEAVAEHAIAMMFTLSRRIVNACSGIYQGEWEMREHIKCIELAGKQLGIIGFGRIGHRIAELGRGIGMQITVYDSNPKAFEIGGYEFVHLLPLDELIQQSDVLTVHMPITTQTRGMIGSKQCMQMKPGAMLVNVARGGIIDEQAAIEALCRGHLGGLGLDVFEHEPPEARLFSKMKGLNIVCTPHMAWNSVEAKERNRVVFLNQIRSLAEGGTPDYRIV